MSDTPFVRAADTFHGHLDKCHQCRENPFALCVIGNLLLRGAVDASPFAPPAPKAARK